MTPQRETVESWWFGAKTKQPKAGSSKAAAASEPAEEPPEVVKLFAALARKKVVELLQFLFDHNYLTNLVPQKTKSTTLKDDQKLLKQKLSIPTGALQAAQKTYPYVTRMLLAEPVKNVSEANIPYMMPEKCEVVAQILFDLATKEGFNVRISHASFLLDPNAPRVLLFGPREYREAHHIVEKDIAPGRKGYVIKHAYVEVEVDGQWWAVDVLAEGFGDVAPVIWPNGNSSKRMRGVLMLPEEAASNLRTRIAQEQPPLNRMLFALNPTTDGSIHVNEEEVALAGTLSSLFLN